MSFCDDSFETLPDFEPISSTQSSENLADVIKVDKGTQAIDDSPASSHYSVKIGRKQRRRRRRRPDGMSNTVCNVGRCIVF